MMGFGDGLGSSELLIETRLRLYLENVVVKTGSLVFMTRISRLMHEEEKGVFVAVDQNFLDFLDIS